MKKIMKVVKAMAANTLVAIFSITCIFPIIWVLYSSLKTDKEFSLDILSLLKHLMFESYTRAIAEGDIGAYSVNSMFNTMITVCIVVAISFVMGYCLSWLKFRGRALMHYIFLSGMLIPIYALSIPIFMESKALGLLNKKYTLILPYIASALSVGVFLAGSSVASASIEIEEAARIDGGPFLRTVSAIVMPMCKPVLSTCATLTSLNTWNKFPLALMLIKSSALRIMPIGLINFVGSYTVNHPLMLTALMVSTLSVVIMCLLSHNQAMKGMMAGAAKD